MPDENEKKLSFKEAKGFITLEYNGSRARKAFSDFISQCDIAWGLCTKTDQSILLKFILTHVVGDVSIEISGQEYIDWKDLRLMLQMKFGENESFEQELYTLISANQKTNEDIATFGNRCLDFQFHMLESVKDVRPSLDSIDSLIRFLVRQIFIERCTPKMSQFLRYTQVQTNTDTNAYLKSSA